MEALKIINSRLYDDFFLISGPCVVESEELLFKVADTVSKICLKNNIPYIFKSSYKKANRTRLDSFTGIGDIEALRLLKKIGEIYKIPVLTDVHSVEEVEIASDFVDVLQIPAFLCRQTELLVAAAKTGKIVNIKKGQFLSAHSMKFAVEKCLSVTSENMCWLTERGNVFGYGDLIVDFCNIPKMQSFNVPVIMDCTHSLQQPNQTSGVTGGSPKMIEVIAKAAVAVGVDGIFIETHPEPIIAKSDGSNMLKLDFMDSLIKKLRVISKSKQTL